MSILSTVVLVGCAASFSQPPEHQVTNTVRLEIRNESELDAVVYAFRLGTRYRLGFVTAHATAILQLPLSQTDNGLATLYVHRIGETADRDFVSNVVQLSDGDRPVLFVNPNLQASSLAVYPERDP